MNYEKVWSNYIKSLPKNEDGGINFNPIEYTKYVEGIIKEAIDIKDLSGIIERHKVILLPKGMRAAQLRDEGIIMVDKIPTLIREILKS